MLMNRQLFNNYYYCYYYYYYYSFFFFFCPEIKFNAFTIDEEAFLLVFPPMQAGLLYVHSNYASLEFSLKPSHN